MWEPRIRSATAPPFPRDVSRGLRISAETDADGQGPQTREGVSAGRKHSYKSGSRLSPGDKPRQPGGHALRWPWERAAGCSVHCTLSADTLSCLIGGVRTGLRSLLSVH